jgi:hypothetical protein
LPRHKFHAGKNFTGKTFPKTTPRTRIRLKTKASRAVAVMARQLLE